MSVIVTGMHRSGTSATARVVEAFGLTAGAGPMMEPAPDNPRGFFERRDVADFNDAWLRKLGGAWWAPPAVRAQTWQHLDELELRGARAQIDLFGPESTSWYSKDPRTALLLPLWDRLALREHPVIVCVRHPGEVAASIGLRNGFSARRALALWSAYTTAAVNHAATRPAMVIDYAAFLDAPTRTAAALEEFLQQTGHASGPDWSLDRAARLLERTLRRASAREWGAELPERASLLEVYRDLAKCHAQPLTEVARIALPGWVEEVLAELRELYEQQSARDAADEEARVLRAERDAWRDRQATTHDAEAEPLRALIVAAEQQRATEAVARGALERHLADVSTQRSAAQEEITRLATALRETETARDAAVERLGQALDEAQTLAGAEHAHRATLTTQLGERADQLARMASELAEARSGLAVTSDQLSSLRAEEGALREHIAAVEQSRAESAAEIARLREDILDGQRQREAVMEQVAAAEESLRERTALLSAAQGSLAETSARLEVAASENRKRQVAMSEMSMELERRRARAFRAEQTVAELRGRLDELESVERAHQALSEKLPLVTGERDALLRALEVAQEDQARADIALQEVWISNSWRCGRAVTAPVRYLKRMNAARRER